MGISLSLLAAVIFRNFSDSIPHRREQKARYFLRASVQDAVVEIERVSRYFSTFSQFLGIFSRRPFQLTAIPSAFLTSHRSQSRNNATGGRRWKPELIERIKPSEGEMNARLTLSRTALSSRNRPVSHFFASNASSRFLHGRSRVRSKIASAS